MDACVTASWTCSAQAGGTTTTAQSAIASCSVTIPASCTSSANACGQTNTGTVQADGQCSATPPPDSDCPAPSALPDLTAGDVTPTTATPGVAVTLSAPVTNTGQAGTGAGFTDLFEINPDAVPATFDDITTLRTYASSALDAGAGNTMSVSYAFAAAGTYYVRSCADLGLDNTGTITESDETNNCSLWTSIIVANIAYPDLTAGPITPISADAGVARLFSASVSDIGAAGAGTFTTLFQTATDANGSGVADLGTANSGSLAANASETVSLSHTFPLASTICARVPISRPQVICTAQSMKGRTMPERRTTAAGGRRLPWEVVALAPAPAPTLAVVALAPSAVRTRLTRDASTVSRIQPIPLASPFLPLRPLSPPSSAQILLPFLIVRLRFSPTPARAPIPHPSPHSPVQISELFLPLMRADRFR